MTTGALITIIFLALAFLSVFWEVLALTINYRWYWKEYRCRLEPWTEEWKRYVKKWWWVVVIKASLFAGACICSLLFFPLPFWAQITVIVIGVIVVAFYSWLLFHLGGYALWIVNKLRGR